MERVFYRLHSRVCTFGLQTMSGRTRRYLERLLLCFSICGFGALILLHVSFVHRATAATNLSDRCLSSIPGISFSDYDVTHVVLIRPEGDPGQAIAGLFTPSSQPSSFFGSSISASSQSSSSPHTYIPTSFISPTNPSISVSDNSISQDKHISKTKSQTPSHSWVIEPSGQDDDPSPPSPVAQYSEILYSVSAFKGYLLLPFSQLRLKHQFVAVHPEDPDCFGEPFMQWLLMNWVGVDTVVHNWLLASFFGSNGHVFDPRTQRIYDLTPPNPRRPHVLQLLLSKLLLVLQITALFGITTALVSFTLRGTQERMLTFTHELSRRVRLRQPLNKLVVTHVLHNLVLFVPIMIGVLFFLVECYNGDKFMAFLVLSIVWVCEVYSIISLRSWEGIIYFPRIFYLLFGLFHVYYFSNPFGGFGYTAFSSVSCFMLHSMLFFWNRYELPAVALGWVTVDRPRMVPMEDEEDTSELTDMNSRSGIYRRGSSSDQDDAQLRNYSRLTWRGSDYGRRNTPIMAPSFPSTSSFSSTATEYSYGEGEEGSSGLQAILRGNSVRNHMR